ncbi:junctional adhesion molecule A [Orussus abietinus]|uniref:junctional adhesion molecule A n=1 Tax=Orussus abietinus TaxID=222816 RepID=UPI000626BBEE|nr:junctional adhesion molecule A [Orussus abietinus]
MKMSDHRKTKKGPAHEPAMIPVQNVIVPLEGDRTLETSACCLTLRSSPSYEKSEAGSRDVGMTRNVEPVEGQDGPSESSSICRTIIRMSSEKSIQELNETFCANMADGRPWGTLDSRRIYGMDLGPEFDDLSTTNVTFLAGRTAYLTCRVRNLGNRTVSWMRHRDVHILTVGAYTYTSDQRFQSLHRVSQEWSEWTLCVKWVQRRDSGIYECQISTIPVRSHTFRLTVIVPTARILNGPDLYVDAGSPVNLTCVIGFISEPPVRISWYYNGQELKLKYNGHSGKSIEAQITNDTTISILVIRPARRQDSGEFTCKPSDAEGATVRVHVLNGEQPEAMQTGDANAVFGFWSWFLLVLSGWSILKKSSSTF